MALLGKRNGLLDLLFLVCFRFYYERLARQSYLAYRQSRLFKRRWQTAGLACAENMFYVEATEHFERAREETPLVIKWRLFWDGLLKKPDAQYYISDFPKGD
ncbi:MAG: hypothetical protein HZA37_02350 [Parcubacteria group bacterium]|nr:hypothetical protein [Parcubacteria group bacterium]